MKEHLQQSIKKIKILEDRVEQLQKLKKRKEAVEKCKKLFHLSTSFAVILLLNESHELFDEQLGVSLSSWDKLMKLHPNNSFNLNWKKQVLSFQLLALLHAKKKKYKTGLKAIYAAQTIVSELDETVERNLDYLMAVNTLTGYLLLSIDKPIEALEFITIAERIAYKLIEKNLAHKSQDQDDNLRAQPANLTSLEQIGEEDASPGGKKRQARARDSVGLTESMHVTPRGGQEESKGPVPSPFEHGGSTERRRDRSNSRSRSNNKKGSQRSLSRDEVMDAYDETYSGRKKSRMSANLLSNFVLGITLLKNISLRYSTPDRFYDEFDQSMNQLMQVEKILFSMGSLDVVTVEPNDEVRASIDGGVTEGENSPGSLQQSGVAVSFLINQHKLEILDTNNDFRQVLKQTFNREFMNMLQVCIFVPFLHSDTPKPTNVPKTAPTKEGVVPQANLIREVLNYRIKVGQVQKDKQERKRIQQDMQELNYMDRSYGYEPSSIPVTGDGNLRRHWDDDSIEPPNDPSQANPNGMNSQEFPSPRDWRRPQQKQESEPKQDVLAMSAKLDGPLRKFKRKTPRRDPEKQIDAQVFAKQKMFAGKRQQKGPDGRSQPRAVKPIILAVQDKGKWNIQTMNNTAQFATTVEDFSKTGQSYATSYAASTKPHGSKRVSQPVIESSQGTINNSIDNVQTFGRRQQQQLKSIKAKADLPSVSQTRHSIMKTGLDEPDTVVEAPQIKAKQRNVSMSQTLNTGPRQIGRSPINILSPAFKTFQQDEDKAVSRLNEFKRGARMHDTNIEKILLQNRAEWTSLYTHPKLMSQYYWKDDKIHTRAQRMHEIKNVIQSDGRSKRVIDIGLQRRDNSGLSRPMQRPYKAEYKHPTAKTQPSMHTDQ